ncbi:hypothetical protein BGAL_0002g00210 [Botrytis galanthina]|uniref:Uncharacterized protein n=1 Tax=Botrytis galanthina TaxID=278940 RepID=A0A4V4HW54_9HELO|nr:hypothetical protein BGAL_0002g00210 [Botrytis galanthina]
MDEIVKAIAPINKEAQTVLKTSIHHRVEGQATTDHSYSTLFPVWDKGIEIVSKREISTAFSAKQTKEGSFRMSTFSNPEDTQVDMENGK